LRTWSKVVGRGAPVPPWLIYVDDELYGDFKTEADREKALPGVSCGPGRVGTVFCGVGWRLGLADPLYRAHPRFTSALPQKISTVMR